MKTLNDYLAAYSEAKNLTSDRQLARDLGITKQAVSAYRNKGVTVNNDTAWKIAEGIGADPLEVISVCEYERAERAHDSARATVWRQRLQQVSACLAMVFVAAALLLAPMQPAQAGAPAAQERSPLYILCQIVPRRWSRFAWHRLSDMMRAVFRPISHNRGAVAA